MFYLFNFQSPTERMIIFYCLLFSHERRGWDDPYRVYISKIEEKNRRIEWVVRHVDGAQARSNDERKAVPKVKRDQDKQRWEKCINCMHCSRPEGVVEEKFGNSWQRCFLTFHLALGVHGRLWVAYLASNLGGGSRRNVEGNLGQRRGRQRAANISNLSNNRCPPRVYSYFPRQGQLQIFFNCW